MAKAKRRVWGSLLSVALVITAGCTSSPESDPGGGNTDGGTTGGGSGEQVALDFWTYEEGRQDNPYHSALVDAFEAEHPNVHIDFTYVPASNYNVKVNTAIAAGKAPDLILAFDLNLLIEAQLLPLDDMVAEHGIDLSTYNQGIIQGPGDYSCSWDGTLYCLGSNQGGWGIFYNKALFDAAGVPYPAAWPPMSVEEFADTACRLTDEAAGVWGGGGPLIAHSDGGLRQP